jgi:hypothetical protein
MLHFELLRDRKILILTPDGPLEAADFERLAKAVDPFIAANGNLAGVMVTTKSFPGWDSFGAVVSHLRFVADHHRRIKRVTAVTDSGFLRSCRALPIISSRRKSGTSISTKGIRHSA